MSEKSVNQKRSRCRRRTDGENIREGACEIRQLKKEKELARNLNWFECLNVCSFSVPSTRVWRESQCLEQARRETSPPPGSDVTDRRHRRKQWRHGRRHRSKGVGTTIVKRHSLIYADFGGALASLCKRISPMIRQPVRHGSFKVGVNLFNWSTIGNGRALYWWGSLSVLLYLVIGSKNFKN